MTGDALDRNQGRDAKELHTAFRVHKGLPARRAVPDAPDGEYSAMKANDIMTVGAAVVHPDTTIAEAARIMLEHRVSGLPVVDAEGKPVGMVTERDLLRRAEIGTGTHRPRWLEWWLGSAERAENYVREHGRKVSDVMTKDVVCVEADTPAGEVVDIMERQGFKRVPVIRAGKVVGIVSRENLVLALSRQLDRTPAPAAGDDLSIRSRIVKELEDANFASSATIDVVVRNGEVELRGTVGDERVRDAVRVAAENVAGVKQVTDRMQVFTAPVGYI